MRADKKRHSTGYIPFYCTIIICLGIFLRVTNLVDFFDGRFTTDEISMSRIYVATVLQGQKYISGATQIIYAAMLATWYGVFGPSIVSARMLSAFLGLAGLFFYFLTLKKLLTKEIALIAVALLSISGYGISFSTFAFEISAVFFYLPLVLWITICAIERKSNLLIAISGFAFGLSCFTYPGVTLGYIALALSLFFCKITTPNFIKPPFTGYKLISIFGISSGLVILSILYLHFSRYTDSGALLLGGARQSNSIQSYVHNLSVLFGDIFRYNNKSYTLNYIFYQAFLEYSLWGFLFWGSLDGRINRTIRVLALAVIFSVLLGAFASDIPGMRRVVCFLLFIYPIIAVGIYKVLIRGKKLIVAISILLILCSHFAWLYQGSKNNLSTASRAHSIPESLLVKLLENGEVFLDKADFSGPYDLAHYKSMAYLYKKFENPSIHENVSLFDANEINLNSYVDTTCRYLISWSYPMKNKIQSENGIVATTVFPWTLYIIPIYPNPLANLKCNQPLMSRLKNY